MNMSSSLFLLIVVLILLFSCNNDKSTISNDNVASNVVASRSFTVGAYTFPIETGTDGHDYYQVVPYRSEYLHYVSCELCAKNKNNLTSNKQ